MEWSPEQERALNAVRVWLQDPSQQVFKLFGYAGTGKTTLARELAAGVDGPVYFGAFTGKAALVLTQKGCTASTIHKLIYLPKDRCRQRLLGLHKERAQLVLQDPVDEAKLAKLEKEIALENANNARPMFSLNMESVLRGAKLVIVDECSMIDQQIGEDLLSFGCKVLALGDPGQLPPIYGKPFFGTSPDFLLTEIHRQARDNPIIRLSQVVREGRALQPGRYGESRVYGQGEVSREELGRIVAQAGQLLVGRNATRGACNKRMREMLARDNPLPQVGDKLVCLRNNHEIGILNGMLFNATHDAQEVGGMARLRLLGEDGVEQDLYAHTHYFHGQKPQWYEKKDAEEFDYGYALTVHKSQGSQWDDVVVLDEWSGSDHKEWLYTAITRAAQRVTVVQM